MKYIKEVMTPIQIRHKIPAKEYLEQGIYPVIDQGQDFISGYTNNAEGVIKNLPVIVFGDHTRVFKYIDFPFVAGADGVKIFQAKPFFVPKLLFYFLQAITLPDRGYARHFQYLVKSKIPVPTVAEQKRIVKKIEELFSVIDTQVKELEQTQKDLNTYRQSVLSQAFSGKLYKTTKWEKIPLKKCCLSVSKRKDSKDKSEHFIYLDIASIDNKTNKILYGTPYTGENAPSRARQIIQKNDILFSTVRTYLKNIALITDSKYNNQIASTGFCVIRANCKILMPDFIFYKTLSNDFLYPLNAKQRGSNYPAVRDADVLNSIISLPSLPEQKAIVERIETAFKAADKAQNAITNALHQAKQLKQSILKRAFEGKLVPQDPNDKPVDLSQLNKEEHK